MNDENHLWNGEWIHLKIAAILQFAIAQPIFPREFFFFRILKFFFHFEKKFLWKDWYIDCGFINSALDLSTVIEDFRKDDEDEAVKGEDDEDEVEVIFKLPPNWEEVMGLVVVVDLDPWKAE